MYNSFLEKFFFLQLATNIELKIVQRYADDQKYLENIKTYI